MKRLLFILFILPTIIFGQLSVGSDQTICLGDSAEIIAAFSGPAATGCSGVADSLITQLIGFVNI